MINSKSEGNIAFNMESMQNEILIEENKNKFANEEQETNKEKNENEKIKPKKEKYIWNKKILLSINRNSIILTIRKQIYLEQ
jgi:hypothetical protein